MDIIQSIILGLIQGATEFLPVSSSGHLVILPYFFKWDYVPLYFTVTVHFGTLAAVVTFFHREIFKIIKAFFQGIFIKNKRNSSEFKLSILLIVATIPAAAAGFLLDDYIGGLFSRPLIVAGFLLVTALFLWLGELRGRKVEKRLNNNKKSMKNNNDNVDKEEILESKITNNNKNTDRTSIRFNYPIALITGVGQAVAIIPGISRAGATISFARFFGIKRSEAVRFSFLLSVPVIFGSFLFELYNSSEIIFGNGFDIIKSLTAGFVSSYIAGILAVKLVVYLAGKRNLNGFALYCISMAAAIFIFYTVDKFI